VGVGEAQDGSGRRPVGFGAKPHRGFGAQPHEVERVGWLASL